MTTPKSDEKEELKPKDPTATWINVKPCPFCGLMPEIKVLGGFPTVFHETDDCPVDARGWSLCVWNARVQTDRSPTVVEKTDDSQKKRLVFLEQHQTALMMDINNLESEMSELRSTLTSQEAVIAVAEEAIKACDEAFQEYSKDENFRDEDKIDAALAAIKALREKETK